jgi:hypothetical protein
MIATARQRSVLFALFALLLDSTAFGDISGNFTLAGDQTFTSTPGDTFTIGGNNNSTFNLQGFTATFTGQGDFDLNARITGSGNVLIDMAGSARLLTYDSADGNAYTGLTTVRGGTLVLDSEQEGNNGVLGNLYIGGGLNEAKVTRSDKHNRDLIADTSTITISLSGTLEFNRMGTGNSHNHDSQETFGSLILDGGTLLNASENSRLTSVNILGAVQLLSSSTIDLGVAMTMHIGDVNTTWWAPDSILKIKNWSPEEPVYVGQITPEQLGQIRFEMPDGLMFAQQLTDGQIVPTTVVPEASAFLFVPLLAVAGLWPELRRRLKARAPMAR